MGKQINPEAERAVYEKLILQSLIRGHESLEINRLINFEQKEKNVYSLSFQSLEQGEPLIYSGTITLGETVNVELSVTRDIEIKERAGLWRRKAQVFELTVLREELEAINYGGEEYLVDVLEVMSIINEEYSNPNKPGLTLIGRIGRKVFSLAHLDIKEGLEETYIWDDLPQDLLKDYKDMKISAEELLTIYLGKKSRQK